MFMMRATKRAEETPKIKTLRENDASFHFLVETIATPIFITRGERLHYVNHAAEVLTGYTRKELLSMNFRDLTPLRVENQSDSLRGVRSGFLRRIIRNVGLISLQRRLILMASGAG